jgi:hypothetical protein
MKFLRLGKYLKDSIASAMVHGSDLLVIVIREGRQAAEDI